MSEALGHMPIIDRNFRAQHEAKAEWAREVERMKLVHMPDPDDIIFDFCTGSDKRLLRFAQIPAGRPAPAQNFFDLPRRGEARLAIPQHSAIVAKARKGTTGMPVVGFISEKGGVGKTTACYHIAIAFAPRFGVGSGMAGSR